MLPAQVYVSTRRDRLARLPTPSFTSPLLAHEFRNNIRGALPTGCWVKIEFNQRRVQNFLRV
jgi:hypothetical protein